MTLAHVHVLTMTNRRVVFLSSQDHVTISRTAPACNRTSHNLTAEAHPHLKMSTIQRIPVSDVVSITVGIGKASASNDNIYYFPVQATNAAGQTSETFASGISELKNDVADPTKTSWANT